MFRRTFVARSATDKSSGAFRFCFSASSASVAATGVAGVLSVCFFTTTAFCSGDRNNNKNNKATYAALPPPEPASMPLSIERDSETGLEVHTLVAPILDDSHVGGFVPCQRPSRSCGPRVEEEVVELEIGGDTSSGKKEKRHIFHHYGHGGAGWSNSLGLTEYIMKLFGQHNFNKDEEIAVVGSGVVGLFTASCLLEQGYKNVTIYAEQDHDLASHNAAGLIGVFASANSGPQHRAILDDGAEATFRYYLDLMYKLKHEKPQRPSTTTLRPSAIRSVKRYMGSPEREAQDCEIFIQRGLMSPPHECLLQFQHPGDEKRLSKRRRVWVVDALFVEVKELMTELEHRVFGGKTTAAKKLTRVENLYKFASPAAAKKPRTENNSNSGGDDDDDSSAPASQLLRERIVFNCTGAGSRELVADGKVKRTGGHTVQLVNQRQDANLDYVIDFRDGLDLEMQIDITNTETDATRKTKCFQMFYFMPKGSAAQSSPSHAPAIGGVEEAAQDNKGCLLGGTLMDVEPGEMFPMSEFERIIKDAKSVFYGE